MLAAVEMSLAEFAAALERKGVDQSRLDFTKPLKIVRQLLVSDTKQNFAGGHDPDGQPWLPLRRPRANSKGNDQPLRNNAILQSSVTGTGAHHIDELTRTSLAWGTNLDYAGIHQHGGTIHVPARRRRKPWVFPGPDGNPIFTRKVKAHDIVIPRRQFLGIGAKLQERIDKVFGDFLTSQMLTL